MFYAKNEGPFQIDGCNLAISANQIGAKRVWPIQYGPIRE